MVVAIVVKSYKRAALFFACYRVAMRNTCSQGLGRNNGITDVFPLYAKLSTLSVSASSQKSPIEKTDASVKFDVKIDGLK